MASGDQILDNLLDHLLAHSGSTHETVPVLLLLSMNFLQKPAFSHLLHTIRVLRNLCAGETSNIRSFMVSGGVKILQSIFQSIDLDEHVVHVGMQVLGNIVLTGNEWHSDVWSHFFPLAFLQVSRVRSKAVCCLSCRILYVLCRESEHRLREMGGEQGVNIMTEIIRTSSTVGFEGDYLPWLLSKICHKEMFFSQLFTQLELPDLSEDGNVLFSLEQLFLLNLLSRIHEDFVSSNFALSVLQILRKASAAVDSLLSMGSLSYSRAAEAVECSLIILRDICASSTLEDRRPCIPSTIDILLSSGLLAFLLDLIYKLGPPEISQKFVSQSLDPQKTYCIYKGYRADIVALVANCAYRRTEVQDQIRQRKGIPLLLQQCVVDEYNPFLREKALWAMRNVLEGNMENQREVAELKFQGTVHTHAVTRTGLQVDVDLEGGRAKLVNASFHQ